MFRRSNRIGTLGPADEILALDSAALSPLSHLVAQIGHSWIESASNTAALKWQAGNRYAHWLTGLSDGALEFPIAHNFGISGTTSDEWLDPGGQVELAAAAPEEIVLISGPTNDQRDVNEFESAVTLANLQAAIDALSGKDHIILTTIPPGGDANFPLTILSPSQLAKRLVVNDGIRAMASARIIIADVWAVMVDDGFSDGRAILGYLTDGIHAAHAAMYIAVRDSILPAIQSRITPRSVVPVGTVGWINSNPLLTGTVAASPGTTGGAAISGNVPTGYALLGSGATGLSVACSVGVDGADTYCDLHITGTPTAGNAFIRLYQNVAGAGIAVSDVLQTIGRVAIVEGQITGLRGLAVGFEARDTGTVIEQRTGSVGVGNGNIPDETLDMVYISPLMTLPAATYTGNNSRTFTRADFTQNIPVDTTIRVYKLGTKKIV